MTQKKDNDTKYADVQDQHANDLLKTMYGHAEMASNSKNPATKTISNLIYYFSNDEVSARISQAFVVSDTNELWSEFQENVNIFNNLNTKYTDEQILEACKEIGAPRRIIYSYIRNGIKMFRRKFTTTLNKKNSNKYNIRRPIRLPENKRLYNIINEILHKYITNNTTRAAD